MDKVFILGNPRSGTSLFRLMLNSHSMINATPECGFLHWWYKKYADWDSSCVTSNRLDEYISDLESSKRIEDWKMDYAQLKEKIVQENPDNYAKLGEIVYVFYGEQKGKKAKVIADKNNYYINHFNDLNEIWPDAKYILVIRDGRDVACSYLNIETLVTNSPYKPKLSTDIKTIAKEWLTNNQNVLSFSESLNNNQFMVIRYEDFVTDSELYLTKVCNFLGLNFESNMLNYYIKNAKEQDEPLSSLDWKKKTLEKPDKDNIGKYKMELEKQSIEEFNTTATDLLQKFNYEI
jgi:hypothetical protein